MGSKKTHGCSWHLVAIVGVLAYIFSGMTGLQAQTGNNAVYTGAGLTLTNSAAFVDASVFTGTDMCQQIYNALKSVPTTSAGTVIDARGIRSGLNCTSGTPWVQSSTNFSNTPATVLLPSGLIVIHQTWVLPNGTRVVGIGAGSSGTGSSGPGTTTIQEATGFTGAMIQLGPNTSSPITLTPCSNFASSSPNFVSTFCMGVSVEDLTLDGNDLATVGIFNGQSREHSYARRVYLYRIPGVGLQVWNNASFSGPYTDITFYNTSSAAAGTECVWIDNVTTRGVHGLNCVAGGSSNAAVVLDGVGNSIEDVQIQGFSDGILVGKDNATLSNVLLNIVGGPSVNNVIHICGSYTFAGDPCPSSPQLVGDLSIMSVATGGAEGAAYSIEDDLSLASMSQPTHLSDPHVAMYVIGEPLTAAGTKVGFTRFSTSPNVPTWVNVKTTTGLPTSCIAGSVMSNSTGVSGSTLWICTGNVWVNVK